MLETHIEASREAYERGSSVRRFALKTVQWTDQDGYDHRAVLRDDDDESKPQYGVPIGPPSMELIDWEGVKREINNFLVQEGVSSYTDLTQSQTAMSFLCNVIKRHVATLYREMERP